MMDLPLLLGLDEAAPKAGIVAANEIKALARAALPAEPLDGLAFIVAERWRRV